MLNLTAADLTILIDATAARANIVWDRTPTHDTEMRDYRAVDTLLQRLLATRDALAVPTTVEG